VIDALAAAGVDASVLLAANASLLQRLDARAKARKTATAITVLAGLLAVGGAIWYFSKD
jgi:hypothetical protein